ncbi:hypothetical protein FSP39_022866 [Pinctada imbricata]|uniref:Uncharacterized protein n=1 Tax=Pinctada imbricata TaxID=66713 RepID=A0AA88XM07_PINIB|nr:hypothetical protein FSP39_022866 [Pinctada imbricata]
MWTRAVWIEKGREEEGVVPSSWIKEDDLYWPPGVNAKKAMEEKRDPGDSWRKFNIIKIKHQSGKFCKITTIATSTKESINIGVEYRQLGKVEAPGIKVKVNEKPSEVKV